jgi:hypothetical protein
LNAFVFCICAGIKKEVQRLHNVTATRRRQREPAQGVAE